MNYFSPYLVPKLQLGNEIWTEEIGTGKLTASGLSPPD